MCCPANGTLSTTAEAAHGTPLHWSERTSDSLGIFLDCKTGCVSDKRLSHRGPLLLQGAVRHETSDFPVREWATSHPVTLGEYDWRNGKRKPKVVMTVTRISVSVGRKRSLQMVIQDFGSSVAQ